MRSIVIVELPRYGLSNRLFVWADALLFSEALDLELFIHGWYKTPIGPWIRAEKSKRFYFQYFKSQTNFSKLILHYLFRSKLIVFNPLKLDSRNSIIFIFNKIPDKSNYFIGYKKKRNLIKQRFSNIVRNKFRIKIDNLADLEIAVHVRLGDFKLINKSKPINYYIEAVKSIRDQFGDHLSVKVFSDGKIGELQSLLALDSTELVSHNNDLLDLLAISKAMYIITTPSSTFSMWGAFLSNGAYVIHSFDYAGIPISRTSLTPFAEHYLLEV